MKKHLLALAVLVVAIPSIAHAAWYNPFTWFNNWTFNKKVVFEAPVVDPVIPATTTEVEVIEVATPTPSVKKEVVKEVKKSAPVVVKAETVEVAPEPVIQIVVQEPVASTTEEIKQSLIREKVDEYGKRLIEINEEITLLNKTNGPIIENAKRAWDDSRAAIMNVEAMCKARYTNTGMTSVPYAYAVAACHKQELSTAQQMSEALLNQYNTLLFDHNSKYDLLKKEFEFVRDERLKLLEGLPN